MLTGRRTESLVYTINSPSGELKIQSSAKVYSEPTDK